MNTTNHWDELKSAGQVVPPSPEVLAHARGRLETTQRRPTRRPLVALVAAGAATAAVIGGVAVYRHDAGQVSGTPAPTPAPAVPSQGAAASCVSAYSLEQLKKRPFAFDGTVLSVAPAPQRGPLPAYALTFAVNQWFTSSKPPKQVVLVTYRPPGVTSMPSESGPVYTVGSRLLVTGAVSDPTSRGSETLLLWGCGFSRPYNPTDAATWRKAFGK
ncbi:hypothetical protein JOF29_001871 [Kribbella aluminosa]|uniref:Uncharacterized protein n=1 Tax=Kribbella aluminosa TaxID=416017 RepID=A0ABS4UGN5_9ACTN|nr:hypothetical protein [Kribbella aluminosa]MBP2350788.1 hypothetical protein [Kribbella aluminosa]